MAWEDHPASRDLFVDSGRIVWIQAEQMNSRDQLTVRLQLEADGSGGGSGGDGLGGGGVGQVRYRKYTTYLDHGAQVALAQLEEMLVAFVRSTAVQLRYLDDTATSGRPQPSGHYWFYSVVAFAEETE